MQSSPFHSDHGSLLDFDHTGTPILGDPDYPFEAALRLGVPISERGLLMGTEQRKLGPQSALLRAAVQPSGMYTVRTASLPVMAEAERQSMGVLPQTSRIMGAMSRPAPVLVEPKAGIAAEIEGTFRQPYMGVKEARRDEATARAFATVQDQTREVRQGLAEAGARYGTSFAPMSSVYGLPDPGNQNWHPHSKKSKGPLDATAQALRRPGPAIEALRRPGLAIEALSAPEARHVTQKGIITNPGPPVPINAATMATMQGPGGQGTFGTWARNPQELAQGYHQAAPTQNLYGGYSVEAAYPAGAVQNDRQYGVGQFSAAAPPGPTIQNTLADPLAIYHNAQALEAEARHNAYLKKNDLNTTPDPTRQPGLPCISLH